MVDFGELIWLETFFREFISCFISRPDKSFQMLKLDSIHVEKEMSIIPFAASC
jgi:hypothetical protein